MKLITVVDIPDEDYYYYLDNGVDKWIIDIDGDIRYLNEDGDAWMHYRSPEDDYVLKPLPDYEKETGYQYSGNPDELMSYNTGLVNGYNAYRREILEEQ